MPIVNDLAEDVEGEAVAQALPGVPLLPARGWDGRATAAILTTLVCWSSVPVFLRYFTQHLDAWTANGVRYPLSALVMAPFLLAAIRGGRLEPGIWSRALWPVFFNTVGQVLWAITPYFLDATRFGFLIRVSVIWAMMITLIFFPAERPLLASQRFWIGFVLAVIGFVGVTLAGGSAAGVAAGKGVVIIVASSLFFAGYGATVRGRMKGDAPIHAFAVISLYTSSILFVLMLFLGDWRRIGALDGGQGVLLVISSLFGIALGHCCYYYALKRLGLLICASLGLIAPFMTGVLATLFLPGEGLKPWQWLFGLCACGGSAMVLWTQDLLHKAKAK